MTPQDFIHKWKRTNLSERSAYQQHFLDLCDLLNQPKPAAEDPEGAFYTFERGVHKTDGSRGWADVWLQGHFAWEYKKKHRDLLAAYSQLQLYRDDLENPPLLVVCDLDRFEIHTNFTNTVKQVHRFDLDHLSDPANLDLLRKIFTAPDTLRPAQTTDDITKEIAEKFAALADGLRARLRSASGSLARTSDASEPLALRGEQADSHRSARFLMKLMFCMFAEDIELLQGKLFARILAGSRKDPIGLSRRLKNLFEAMAQGGEFGADVIRHFNGGLFKDADVIDLTWDEIEVLIQVNDKDWSNVEPSIFGTLFLRTLDPAKRAQIGAQYTSRADILTLLEPVLMAPLRREWDAAKAECLALWPKVQEAARKGGQRGKPSAALKKFEATLRHYLHRLAEVKILDPACGSGNFLYVAINLLLDLEKQVIAFASTYNISLLPHVRPTQLLGIEINPFAQELAQVVIWIGYLQWMQQNGFIAPSDPVLEPFENIQNKDAILDLSDPANPKEPDWPAAEFIVGNPPFLGGKKQRAELNDEYIDKLFQIWNGRVTPGADICCYWFEKAREQIKAGKAECAGLLATQGIRGGANRDVLKRIKESGSIFFAESDRDWILDGANVHISMVGFNGGEERSGILDGISVADINADLTAHADTTKGRRLPTNVGICFMGDTKGGPFDIPEQRALEMLTAPNPHGRPNSDVIVPWVNGMDVTRRSRDMWIIDFGVDVPDGQASLFESPFQFVRQHLKELRNDSRTTIESWWLHERPRPDMRNAFVPLPRFIASPSVAKHRLFVWMAAPTLPDHQLFAFARSDDYSFGVLHSRIHELWGLKQGTRLETRPRYTSTTCFETFPFPNATPEQQAAIAAAAKELDTLRTNWLNPPEWTRQEVLEFPGSTTGPWTRYLHDLDARGIGTVRYPRLVAKNAASAKTLQKRTLTNLYNERPTWLALAHKKLDAAVAAAYGWPAELAEEEILGRLLKLNLERTGR